MKNKDSQRSNHLTTTYPLLGETYIYSFESHNLHFYGWVLNNFKPSQKRFLDIINNITYHSFPLHYPSKGNLTNTGSSTPFFTPHLTSQISSFLSLNPIFIKSPLKDHHIREKRKSYHIQRS